MARILIVEDDKGLAKLYAAMATVDGHHAKRVDTGEAALLEILEETLPDGTPKPPYDVMILDIGLPRIDGYSFMLVLDRLRRQGVYTPPVVVLSGQVDQGNDIKAYSAGASKVLLKPKSHAEIMAAVDQVLNGE